MPNRIIAHLDLDAFFASVEEREKPYLKGFPIAVGADPRGGTGRGVVATASYAARAYGIKSATPIRTAWKLSEAARASGKPACIFITPQFGKYEAASSKVFTLIRAAFSRVEQVGVDEGYADLSSYKSFAKARQAARAVKEKIHTELGLTITIGIGPNKMAAKLASDAGKPDGLMVIAPGKLEAFMLPLSLKDVPGIGRVTAAKLAARGLHTIEDARALSWQELRRMFGTHGFSMYERFRGIDDRELEDDSSPPLSIGKHHTFDVDTSSRSVVLEELERQAARIMAKLKGHGYVGFRHVTLTVRFEDFETVTRSLTLTEGATTLKELELKALKLVLPFFEKGGNPCMKAIRLIGLSVGKLA